MVKKKTGLCLAVASVIAAAAPAFASSIATVETQASGSAATIGDVSTPVISNILSSPQSLDGYTYTNWAFFANDGTGSIDVFGKMPTGSTYTPTVGDAISATGTYSPFDGIPEMASLTAISQLSTGNTPAAPTVTTVPGLWAGNGAMNTLAGSYLTLDNVYLVNVAGGATVFPTHANLNFTITDDGPNPTDSVAGFFWASSYSTDGALAGTPIPLEADISGFVDTFGSSPEFVPLSITAVPEPASMGLLAVGAAMLLRRKARKA